MELNEIMERRKSIRHYEEGRVIPRDVTAELLKAAQKAPSWKNSQTGRYYVLESKEKQEEIRACLADFNRKSSSGASLLIVTTFVCGIAGFTAGEPDNELGDEWGAYDLGLQNAYLLLKASELGLDSLVMGVRDGDAIRKALELPDDEEVATVIALGYRSKDCLPRPRKELEEIAKFI